MKAIDFPESTVQLGKDQEEYETLPAKWNPNNMTMTCCFELSKEEIDEINRTGKIWFRQLTFGQKFQPVSMSTRKEDLL